MPDSSYFNQFSTPPPMMQPILTPMMPFPPPPPHLFMGGSSSLPPPPLQMRPDMSCVPNTMMATSTNYVDYQRSGIEQGITSMDSGTHNSNDINNGTLSPPQQPAIIYSPQPLTSPRFNDNHRLPQSPPQPPFLRSPAFRNPIMMPGRPPRFMRPPGMRFMRAPPPPGFPVFHPAMINRPPVSRF